MIYLYFEIIPSTVSVICGDTLAGIEIIIMKYLKFPKIVFLDGILDLAENGTTVSEICTFIHKEVADISQTEIDGYVELLLENNILVDRLPPYMTSQEDPLSELEEYLKLHNYDTKILKPIIDVQNKIDSKFLRQIEQ